jgi:hypothetical protein
MGPVHDALADRDAADDALDTIAQNGRLGLASRSLDADKKAPYALIFHKGIAYYTAARLEDQECARQHVAGALQGASRRFTSNLLPTRRFFV